MDQANTIKSWQEAFESNKIPSIRDLEAQLRAGVSRDKERLRDLVGGNYRDLLSTADHIIHLAAKTRAAEGQLSDIGQRCEPSQRDVQKQSLPLSTGLTAQARALTQCILCATTALRRNSILLSAKLMVISRLLIKSLSESEIPLQVIEQLRVKAASLRRKLLRRIDQELKHPRSDTKTLVDAICAYCLITSASSADAIKHFQQLRLDKLRQRLTSEPHSNSHITETFQYLVSSIQSLQTLLGRAVNDPISNLQQSPILEDPSVAQLEPIGVDQARKLIPMDITSFTPYIKRVLIRTDEIRAIVEAWTTDACGIFCEGLIPVFAKTKTVVDVLSLRKDLLNILLPVYFTTYAQQILLNAVREAISSRLLDLNRIQVKHLLQISQDMVNNTSGQPALLSPWEDTFVKNSLTTYGPTVIRQLRGRHHGTKGDLDRNLKRLRTWAKTSAQMQRHIEALRSIRWQDVIEEADEEDEKVASKIVSQLVEDDPQHLQDSIEQNLETAVVEFEKTLQQAVADTVGSEPADFTDVTYLIRLVRESAAVMGEIMPKVHTQKPDLLVKLQDSLVSDVIQKLTLKYEVERSSGTAAAYLPEDLPSPLTISVLRDTCTMMSNVGGIDVWSQSAVSRLKNTLREKIWNDNHKASYMQTDFDEAYLQAVLMTTQSSSQDSEAGTIAAAYWNRTKLLFGILN